VDDWTLEVLDGDYDVGSRVGSASVNRASFGPLWRGLGGLG
jgi:hypothetical protein